MPHAYPKPGLRLLTLQLISSALISLSACGGGNDGSRPVDPGRPEEQTPEELGTPVEPGSDKPEAPEPGQPETPQVPTEPDAPTPPETGEPPTQQPDELPPLEPFDTTTYSGQLDFVSDSDGRYRTTLRITNPHELKTSVALEISGYLFRDREALLTTIRQMPEHQPGEPDYVKAWRLVSLRHYHADPYIAGIKTHDPLLSLNSVGFGYCDDFAAVLATIWRWLGYESRVWGLQGHIVPEIRIDGRWQMFDPDYGVYYLDNDGEVASVESLSGDPSLIVQPVNPVREAAFPGYSQWLADIYDGRESNDNMLAEVPALEEHAAVVEMPAGAALEFPVQFNKPIVSYYGTTAPVIGAAELTLPAGASAELRLPFVVIDVRGDGLIQIDGAAYEADSPILAERLRGNAVTGMPPADAVTRITIVDAREPLTITMAVNPMITDGAPGAMVQVLQPASAPRVLSSASVGSGTGFSAKSELLSTAAVGPLGSPVLLRIAMDAMIDGG